ncbi:hypothetical protein LJC26_04005 [Desulfovibrio sp. OttesenSCG-928-O18]|nr:hypothetical protein [Desulfovibrio sp. OttesenSCG-928-O18]
MKQSVLCLLALIFTAVFPLCVYAETLPRVVHVVVALCDNVNQGIVPVPSKLGNGADPANNLYWGAAYGVKSFMRKQPGWVMKPAPGPVTDSSVLERVVFFNAGLGLVVVADAYDGSAIRKATRDFLNYAARKSQSFITVGGKTLGVGGNSDLVVYVGHNGLMDFRLTTFPRGVSEKPQFVAIFACRSKAYFTEAIKESGAYPLVWTRGNMAPEAYSLHALLTAWAAGKKGGEIREAVAQAYNTYQKCGIKGARGLFATGW